MYAVHYAAVEIEDDGRSWVDRGVLNSFYETKRDAMLEALSSNIGYMQDNELNEAGVTAAELTWASEDVPPPPFTLTELEKRHAQCVRVLRARKVSDDEREMILHTVEAHDVERASP